MALEIRTITEDEAQAWYDAMAVGFLQPPTPGAAEPRRVDQHLDRTWAAFDGARMVATLRSFPTPFTVPGGDVPAAALTQVTVTATHRRRGLLTRMLDADLAAAHERGEAVGILIAAEYPIYGRFGYGPAFDHVTFTLDARAARFRQPPTGSVELVDAATLRKQAPAIFERHRRIQVGERAITDGQWDRWLGMVEVPGAKTAERVHALGYDDEGRPDGYLTYHVTEGWERRRPQATLVVDELTTDSVEAAARLWAYACGIDWVATVEAGERGLGDPLPWLLVDARVAAVTEMADHVWVRPLDLTGALEGRRYLTHGRVVLEVVDPQGFASGRVVLDGGPDGATVAPITESPGLTLPVDTLGAAYVGGHTLRELARVGRLDVHDDRALAVADAMFRSPVTPWCSAWF